VRKAGEGANLVRAQSTSSISSLSSVCSSAQGVPGQKMDSDAVSVTSVTSSVSPEALQVHFLPTTDTVTQNKKKMWNERVVSVFQNIREQMASSLQKIREMEDQVKTIPMLQVSQEYFTFTSFQ
jgi:hypothetical protein